jgi:hypothetical protein
MPQHTIAPVDLDHIQMQVYGPRNQLLGHVRVPASELPQFMVEVERIQQINPAYSVASIVRWALRAGWRQVARAQRGQIPIPTLE